MPTIVQLALFPLEKTCRVCGLTQPITAFRQDGRRFIHQCRACCADQFRAWVAANAEHRAAYTQTYNRAYREKNGEALKAAQRARYAANPEVRQEAVDAVRAWRAADPEKTKARRHAEYLGRLLRYPGLNKAFYEKHKESIKVRAKVWRQENPERHRQWAKENPEQHRAIIRAWEQRNHDRLRAAKRAWNKAHPLHAVVGAHIRRARIRACEGRYTVADVERIYREQGGLCAYCHVALHGIFDVEHRIPLARGGTNWPENIACACPPCNGRKGTMTDREFMARLAAHSQSPGH